jgi:histidine kinase
MRSSIGSRAAQYRRTAAWTLLLIGSTLLAAWGAGKLVEARSLRQEGAAAREKLALHAAALRGYIDRYRTLPAVLALDPELRAALAQPLSPALQARLNRRLETVNGVTQSSTLTLIDREGRGIAASNWRLPTSNVGYDYAFRPYFQSAITQGSGRFYAVGATTGMAGYFLSEAIHGDDGQPLGVIVIKLDLLGIETQWLAGRDIILISDEHDVVILANREPWHYRELRTLGTEELTEIERTRQYSAQPLLPLPIRVQQVLDDGGRLVRIDDPRLRAGTRSEWLWQTYALPSEAWTLHLLRDPAAARTTAEVAGLAAGGVWLAMNLLGLFVQGRMRLARLRKRSREELEQMVKQHASALRTAEDGVVEAARKAALGLSPSLEHLPQGVSVVDANLRLLAWNRRYVDYFRYPQELMQIGRPIEDLFRYNAERGLFGGDDPPAAIAKRLEHLRAATPYLHERERPDGTVLEIRGNPVPGGGFVTSYADITAYKNAARELRTLATSLELRVAERTHDLQAAKAEAERANRYKTRFVAAAVHDLLQPLNAARMFVSALRDRMSGSEAKALADNVEGALTAQDEILGSLLDISRLESGTLEIRRRHLALGPMLESLAREVGVLAQAKGLQLRYHPTQVVVDSDEALLRRILQNFLSNALRYTARGGILLGVRRERGAVRIEVWDSGPGIPEEQHTVIFEEFRRLDSGGDLNERGAGLGLAIVERIARLLGHRISLRSWPGRGSVFAVTVPLGDAAAIAVSEPPPPTAGDSLLRGRVIWCLDDDPRVGEGTRALLSGWGCRPVIVRSAEEALQLALPDAVPDLLLLDYRLGDALGPDVALALFERWGRPVPVIVISADRDAELRERARAAGWGFLPKPIRPAALRALMTQMLMRVA